MQFKILSYTTFALLWITIHKHFVIQCVFKKKMKMCAHKIVILDSFKCSNIIKLISVKRGKIYFLKWGENYPFSMWNIDIFTDQLVKYFFVVTYIYLYSCSSQCCGSGMIYSGSGSSFEFSEFWIRIQAKVPDPCGSGSNLY